MTARWNCSEAQGLHEADCSVCWLAAGWGLWLWLPELLLLLGRSHAHKGNASSWLKKKIKGRKKLHFFFIGQPHSYAILTVHFQTFHTDEGHLKIDLKSMYHSHRKVQVCEHALGSIWWWMCSFYTWDHSCCSGGRKLLSCHSHHRNYSSLIPMTCQKLSNTFTPLFIIIQPGSYP